jgi:hypothetical protein
MKNFNYMDLIERLVSFSPRQFEGEDRAAEFIKSLLKKNKISFKLQGYSLKIPKIKAAKLRADGKEFACAGCSFVGGKIGGKEIIISSLTSSLPFSQVPNINFNPLCTSISRSNHYFAPSLAVAPTDIKKIIDAKSVSGMVEVEAKSKKSVNILVGNCHNPKNICFAHYDSIGPGAADDASGVALLLGEVLCRKETLENTLYVFVGNEELSYDRPVYWGHGYRAFESKFSRLFRRAEKIIIVECLGLSRSLVSRDSKLIPMAFPVKGVNGLKSRIYLLTGEDYSKLMSIYHSDLDDGGMIKKGFLQKAERLLRDLLA